MLLPRRWQFPASPMAVYCHHDGRLLPTPLAEIKEREHKQTFLEQKPFFIRAIRA